MNIYNQFKKFAIAGICLTAITLTGCGGSGGNFVVTPVAAQAAGFTSFTGSGAANVATAITNFQNALGGANNASNPGPIATGFRSINWDAGIVPVQPAAFPENFFNTTAGPTRGLIVGAGGNAIQASNNDFAGINATYAGQFEAFSNANTFGVTANTNILWARFELPAAAGVPGRVQGFGAVFSDVDVAGSTTIEFFNGNTSLGTFEVPVRTDANGHSFLGVVWTDAQRVTACRLTLGNGNLGAANNDITDGGANDLVVVDDFFYGEPQLVGTP